MPTDAPRDQPSGVATEDQPRPQDEHVVTSDVIQESPATPSATETPGKTSAAADTDNGDGSNSQDSATATNNPAPKSGRRAQRKIKKLGQKLSAAEQRDAENQRRIAELEARVDGLTKATPKPEEPQLEDFASPKEYAKAYTKWEQDTETPPPPKRTQEAPATPDTGPIPDTEIQAFMQRGTEKLGDEFSEAMQESATAVNQYMAEFVMDSDHGPEIYVHLANNPDEARKIHDSSPLRAQKALEKLQAHAQKGELDVGEEGQLQVETQPDTPSKKPTVDKKTTRAPTPPSNTKDGAGVNLTVNPEDEGMDDYAARRQKEEMRRMGYSTS